MVGNSHVGKWISNRLDMRQTSSLWEWKFRDWISSLQALLNAMQHTWVKGYHKIVFKGDNKHVHDLLTTSKKNFQIYDWIQEIWGWKEKFEDVKFRRIPREDNKAADSLAKQFQDSSKFCNESLVNLLEESGSIHTA